MARLSRALQLQNPQKWNSLLKSVWFYIKCARFCRTDIIPQSAFAVGVLAVLLEAGQGVSLPARLVAPQSCAQAADFSYGTLKNAS